eukprot:jgi/Tetstr1/465546/TSEL_010215.t1
MAARASTYRRFNIALWDAAELARWIGDAQIIHKMTNTTSNPFANYKTKEFHGHREKVYTVAWNCTGKRLASGSLDKTARIWTVDVQSQGKLAKADIELKGHQQSVDNLCWDPTHADRLATASCDKTVRIWDTRASKCMETINGTGANLNVTWSPDGNTVAFGNREDVISFLDIRKMKVLKSHNYSYEVNEICWNKSSDLFLLTTGNGTIEMLQYPSMESVHSLKAHTSNCFCIGFDPAEKYLASGGADALVSLWDVEDLVCIQTFIRMDTPVRTLDFSHDSTHLAFAAEDSIIEIVDVTTGSSVHQISCNSSPDNVAWSPKHKVLAFAGEERDARSNTSPVSVYFFVPS